MIIKSKKINTYNIYNTKSHNKKTIFYIIYDTDFNFNIVDNQL